MAHFRNQEASLPLIGLFLGFVIWLYTVFLVFFFLWLCIKLWYHTQPTSVALIRVCRYGKSKRFRIWERRGYGNNKLVCVS